MVNIGKGLKNRLLFLRKLFIEHIVTSLLIIGGYGVGMNHTILKVLISIAIILSLASTGVCAILSPHTLKAACEKNKSFNNGIGAAASGQCKVRPCHSEKGQLFLLPDASAGRFKTENRQAPQSPGPAAILTTHSLLSDPQAAKAFPKPPLSYYPPPLFYLHCSLIC